MSELQQIVALWRAAKAQQEEVCLATVVRVEGSSYRKPGARMLLTRSGQRAGTISGGCLEAEVAKKAWWLTENGPTIQHYSSFFDDDSPAPYGLGCGGTVHVLLDRGASARSVLDVLEQNLLERSPFVIITDTNKAATLLIERPEEKMPFALDNKSIQHEIGQLARRAIQQRHSYYASLHANPDDIDDLFVEYIAPPHALTIFGAGDDAKPLADFAKQLGWHVTIADGRSHLARPERFPVADRLVVLDYNSSSPLDGMVIDKDDAVVLLTHSYEQDSTLLRELLPRELKYLGVLGPRKRIQRIVNEIAASLDLSLEECMARLHAPVGFDIGAHTPESIALSIATEIFAVLNGREGMSLKNTSQSRQHINTKLLHV
jgi:xanthine/CO dehydrogenase XdhC/CoxF family maturation factor